MPLSKKAAERGDYRPPIFRGESRSCRRGMTGSGDGAPAGFRGRALGEGFRGKASPKAEHFDIT